MAPVINADGISKKYLISHRRRERYTALRDEIASSVRRIGTRVARKFRFSTSPLRDERTEEFWALKDVSFEVEAGDRVGIIGRNGAGKSTLLKILSRITEPSRGRVRITGRVASLLEVGTGFHPELTGRENIFLNGAILGMRKGEIKRKFDEIVGFAEVEKFLDTPIKRYSSGMYVRLAFAVAAHLEPDILIVDEVLAVGDAQFQKKCMRKLDDASRLDGRTVLFVSHNMAAISNLCQKGLVLDAGELRFRGTASEAILHYYRAMSQGGGGAHIAYDPASGKVQSANAALLRAELLGVSESLDVTIHDDVAIRMAYRLKQGLDRRSVPNFHVHTADGTCAFVTYPVDVKPMPPGDYSAECRIPGGLLNEGAYSVGIALTTYNDHGQFEVDFQERSIFTFNVIDPIDERSNRYGYAGPMPGVVRPSLSWTLRRETP